MYQVVIIEDDPMVASINKSYVEKTPGFAVQGVFKSGADALGFIKKNLPDLIILDFYTPRMNGDEFLDCLHRENLRPAVIMVTSANSAETVRDLLLRGVMDYLVKPFEFERFRGALERFRSSRELIRNAGSGMGQAELDRLFSGSGTAGGSGSAELPKGMNGKTLEMIRDWMKEHRERQYTSEEIAEEVGLSRITVRRYVNYMVETGELNSHIDYQTGGRPGILYQYRK